MFKNTAQRCFQAIIFLILSGVLIYVFCLKPIKIDNLPDIDSSFYHLGLFIDYTSSYDSVDSSYRDIEVKGVIYQVFSSDWKIDTIRTCDPNFKNADGISPGDISFDEITDQFNNNEFVVLGVKMTDKWTAVPSRKNISIKELPITYRLWKWFHQKPKEDWCFLLGKI
tara:strand:+ start:753 stop:1256 length:504 start_codon:yes stop_codon:yes gene_type:complete